MIFNYTLTASITCEGVYLFTVQDKPMNTVDFKGFLTDLLRYLDQNNKREYCLIMDNARLHTSAELKSMVEDEGHKLMLLPPYSPFLNPIENLFSQWKSKVRGANINSEDALFEAIKKAKEEISGVNCCKNYFRHIEDLLPDCRASKPIYTD